MGGRKYIKPYVLVKKFLLFIGFPLFVLSNPLIVSLTILPNYSLPTIVRYFIFISAFFSFVGFCGYRRIRNSQNLGLCILC
jgi:hypothetical protein